MIKKVFLAIASSLILSTTAAASDGIITVLNYSNTALEIRVFDGNFKPVIDTPLMINEKVSGHWITQSSSWLGNATFDSVHVFAVEKSGAMTHCGDIPGGDPIPWMQTVQRIYEIDECGTTPSSLRWHTV